MPRVDNSPTKRKSCIGGYDPVSAACESCHLLPVCSFLRRGILSPRMTLLILADLEAQGPIYKDRLSSVLEDLRNMSLGRIEIVPRGEDYRENAEEQATQ